MIKDRSLQLLLLLNWKILAQSIDLQGENQALPSKV